MAYNRHIIEGRLVADPELVEVGGSKKANFRVAVDRNYKTKDGGKETDFFNVEVWGDARSEFITKYFKKGSAILVEGPHENYSFTDKDGNTRYNSVIKATDVRFTEGSGKSDNTAAAADSGSSRNEQPAEANNNENDDDLPF